MSSKLPIFKTIRNSTIFIRKNYKASIGCIFFITLIQFFQNVVDILNPTYTFAALGITLFSYAFIYPLFNIRKSKSAIDFVKKYALSGVMYAFTVLTILVLYSIFDSKLFYYIFYSISIYTAYFFIVRMYFKKKKLFNKDVFIDSIKRMISIILIIFAAFMIMYLMYKGVASLLQFAVFPEIIEDNIISKADFLVYSHYLAVILIYLALFSSFVISGFAWIAEIDEQENSISLAFMKLGNNFMRLGGVILTVYLISLGVDRTLHSLPLNYLLLHYIIDSILIFFTFITYLEAYRYIYKVKR